MRKSNLGYNANLGKNREDLVGVSLESSCKLVSLSESENVNVDRDLDNIARRTDGALPRSGYNLFG